MGHRSLVALVVGTTYTVSLERSASFGGQHQLDAVTADVTSRKRDQLTGPQLQHSSSSQSASAIHECGITLASRCVGGNAAWGGTVDSRSCITGSATIRSPRGGGELDGYSEPACAGQRIEPC